MKYCENKVTDMKIAYIGGGSRGWAWTFMTDMAKEPNMSGTIRLYDLNLEAAKANQIIGNRLSEREDVVGKWKYEVAETLEEALTGIDFVMISILPKGFKEMGSDVHAPEKYGIYQSVGDTAGPGGIIRALRTLPVFVDFAKAIKEYCPDAWVINYTNPMSLCVKALYYGFPQIKAFGCCHEVFGTQKVLASILAKETGIEKPHREKINVNVLGINHFTWFDYASYEGLDLFPIYKKYVEEHYEEGLDENDGNWANNSFECANRVKFDLFKNYGLIAAAGDRHLAEFMPGDIYLKDPETVRSWKFGLTHINWRWEDLERKLARAERLVKGEEELPLIDTGEEGVRLIKALAGLDRFVTNVNVPNTNRQINNLPETAIVETNALFERDAIRPLNAGSVPENVKALLMPHIENHETVMEAAMTLDKELVIKAFQNDPLVKGRITEEQIRALVDEMMAATL